MRTVRPFSALQPQAEALSCMLAEDEAWQNTAATACARFDTEFRRLIADTDELVQHTLERLDAAYNRLAAGVHSGAIAGAIAEEALRGQLTQVNDAQLRMLSSQAGLQDQLDTELQELGLALSLPLRASDAAPRPLQRCGSSGSLAAAGAAGVPCPHPGAPALLMQRRSAARELCSARRETLVARCFELEGRLWDLLDHLE